VRVSTLYLHLILPWISLSYGRTTAYSCQHAWLVLPNELKYSTFFSLASSFPTTAFRATRLSRLRTTFFYPTYHFFAVLLLPLREGG